MYRKRGKRILDLLVTVPMLFLLSPVLGAVALLVLIKLGVPVFLLQRRPGLNGEPFTLMKFRSMTGELDSSGVLLPDARRLTPFGRFLRNTSLDELPELLNVLRGQMSLVGPRPLLMEYLERYSPQQARRNEVKPGITGWAQVNGRNAISWEEKFERDVYYVNHISLALDLKIIWLTLPQLLKREGVSAEGHSTMPVFTGSRGHER